MSPAIRFSSKRALESSPLSTSAPQSSLIQHVSRHELKDHHRRRPRHPVAVLLDIVADGDMHTHAATTMTPPEHPPDTDASGSEDSSTQDSFFWAYTEEPHRTRRQAIIKAHPEVTKLCGPEPWTKYVVLAVVGLQITCSYLLRHTPILSWTFLVTAYVVGATANQNLFLAIHEISHNLAFRSARANRLFAVFANLPIGIPYSAAFRVRSAAVAFSPDADLPQPYHLTHHKSLGVDGLDTDLPTALEAMFLDSVLGKAFFCTFQILFYALRPMMVYQLPLTGMHVFNIAAQLAFDVMLVRVVGPRALAYLVMSSFLAGSLHPCAGHFIAEHYVFEKPAKTQAEAAIALIPETFSYYGPLNVLTYNVGLHNEHHDFPAVPWTRLPALHATAREFYRDLPHHQSWTWVIWQFIWDKDVGLWCRVKRKQGGRKVGSEDQAADGAQARGAAAWQEEELGASEARVPGVRGEVQSGG